MSFGMRILMGLAALLAVAGYAAAQCPECDPDGEPGTSGSYSSVDLGVITDQAGAIADTDVSVADSDDPKGFWAWLSVCLTAFITSIEGALGVDTGIDAAADAYVSEDGIDVDAHATLTGPACDAVAGVTGESCAFDLDESELGDLDGLTWDVMADAHETVGDDKLVEDVPVDGSAIDGLDVDLCIVGELALATCG